MGESKKNSNQIEDAELERQILEDRKFSLEEAIGRQAGGDLMKGASPVTLKQQADYQIKSFIERNLVDAEGTLSLLLERRVVESELLLEAHYEGPLSVLRQYIDGLLSSEPKLVQFVRDVDVAWGRANQERPHFEKAGQDPSEDDPYTISSVRSKLEQLGEKLRFGG